MSASAAGGGDGVTRVYLHIGAPKTGTTYLQHVLFQNRERLAKAGVLYPYTALEQSFRSAHDFCGTGWFGHEAERFRGEWEQVAKAVREWSGPTAILSSELLAAAPAGRIADQLERLSPAEVHVVFSARDLARQLVSDWQEQVKHKHTVTLERFVDDLVELGLDAPKPFGRLFWGMHDAAYVLRRWGAVVPPERIHVVTVPPPGGPKAALWERFCAVTGMDPTAFDTSAKRSNPSMGVAETELVRRINRGLRKMDGNSYDVLVRLFLADKVLGGGGTKLSLPPHREAWVRERSQLLVEQLQTAGYHVEGDLAELIPGPREVEYVSPTALTDGDLGTVAIKAATALLKQAGKLRDQNRKLRARLDGESAAGAGRGLPTPRALASASRRLMGRVRPARDGGDDGL